MPLFSYDARNGAGQPQRGTLEAASAAALVNSLRARGWLVLNVRSADSTTGTDLLTLLNPFAWLPPRLVDIELSLQQIAVMVRSGLTLLSSLRTVAEQAPRASMRRVWADVAERIQQGSSLADAMTAHRCFSHTVLQLVRVGEQTGTLDQVLSRAAEALERRRLLRTRVLSALMYPAIVLAAAIGVASFMVLSVVPKLRRFLAALGRRLPAMTQMLVDISDFAERYLPAIGIGLLGLTGAMILVYRWPPGRLFVDRWLLRLPVVGQLLRLGATVQFAHGLGVLLRSGVTLVEGLRTVEQMHRNQYLAGRVAEARQTVLGGGSLAAPLAERGAYMPMLSRMVAVGESAGTLDEVLEEVARFHDNQLQNAIRQFSAIVEPVIIVVVGSIVGFVYIAFFVALSSAAGGFK